MNTFQELMLAMQINWTVTRYSDGVLLYETDVIAEVELTDEDELFVYGIEIEQENWKTGKVSRIDLFFTDDPFVKALGSDMKSILEGDFNLKCHVSEELERLGERRVVSPYAEHRTY